MWCERWSVCAEHKDTNWPEAQLHMLFSQEFILGRKGLGGGKIKSLFCENGKNSWPGSNSKLASGTKEACNGNAVDKEKDVEGAPFLLSLPHWRRYRLSPTAGWPGTRGHHRLECPGRPPSPASDSWDPVHKALEKNEGANARKGVSASPGPRGALRGGDGFAGEGDGGGERDGGGGDEEDCDDDSDGDGNDHDGDDGDMIMVVMMWR